MADAMPIKPDPEAEKSMDDEDLSDEAGDLEFYDKQAANRQFETLYLARVPRSIYDAWVKMTERLGDDDEIQLGTLRTWNEAVPDAKAPGGSRDVTKLRMLLNPSCPEHQPLPREYDMDIVNREVEGQFIFSEEDLPSYRARNKARAEAVRAGIPAALLRQRGPGGSEHGPMRNAYDRRSRFQPYYRKAIPKKTKIFGKIHYDIRAEPRNVQEEERLLAQRLFEAENNKPKLQIISKISASSIMNAGTAVAAQWGGNFIVSQASLVFGSVRLMLMFETAENAPQPVKARKGEVLKAARIPKNQLLDLIFDCFRQYQYWSMKALRQRLQQPDSYLRQVLDEVAVLHKSGRFANHYGLSDAYKDKAGSEAKEEAAEADEGDDEEPEELEDVLPLQ